MIKKFALLPVAVILLAACSPAQRDSASPTPAAEQVMMDDVNRGVTPTDSEIMVDETSQTSTKSVTLSEQSDSGQTGVATLEEVDGKVKITLSMSGTSSTVPQPAHIHVGACPTPGDVKFPLSNVVNGKSETVLSTTMAELMAMGKLAINVHKSAQEVKVYTACGNIE